MRFWTTPVVRSWRTQSRQNASASALKCATSDSRGPPPLFVFAISPVPSSRHKLITRCPTWPASINVAAAGEFPVGVPTGWGAPPACLRALPVATVVCVKRGRRYGSPPCCGCSTPTSGSAASAQPIECCATHRSQSAGVGGAGAASSRRFLGEVTNHLLRRAPFTDLLLEVGERLHEEQRLWGPCAVAGRGGEAPPRPGGAPRG